MTLPESIPPDRLCIALDTPDLGQALEWCRALRGEAGWFKVGLTLFVRHGPAAVDRVAAEGAGRVFLDLKLHDIPAQVQGAVASAADAGAELLTIHASGGPAMMRAAAEARRGAMRLVAVTVLTSLSEADVRELWPGQTAAGLAGRLAALAAGSGLDGIVLSPREVAAIRRTVPEGFWLVTPGIRPDGGIGIPDDQARTATPWGALRAGADLLVIGRPVTGAPDPVQAIRDLRRPG
ncbi:orotidine-5'-phosphate decarboxylase [Myxococcota bacterium]|nr:orotidine-5'-phosphate decarboxylase [Myxococcota bacterium]